MSALTQKLAHLTSASRFDLCVPGECLQILASSACVTYYRSGSSSCGRMLKVLLYGSCSYDCAYCPVRADRTGYSFAPDELARTFLSLYWQNRVGGLFLSSGIPHDVDLVMGDLLETARLLRSGGYDGYLHLKILPGSARTDITEAARLANRISINVETTGPSRLRALTGVKDYEQDIRKRLAWVADAKPGRHTTQLVVGAAGETDAEILSCVAGLYGTVAPSRIYYSAFQAMPKTRFAERSSTPAWRTNRWYQMDYLMREYGMHEEDLRQAIGNNGALADADPKEVLARGLSRIDPNAAQYEELIRVPGIGPETAAQIVRVREGRPVTAGDIGAGRLIPARAAPFLSVRQETGRQETLALF